MSHPFEPHAGGVPEIERRYATYAQATCGIPRDDVVPQPEAQRVNVTHVDVSRAREVMQIVQAADPAERDRHIASYTSRFSPEEVSKIIRALVNGDALQLPSAVGGISRRQIIHCLCGIPLSKSE